MFVSLHPLRFRPLLFPLFRSIIDVLALRVPVFSELYCCLYWVGALLLVLALFDSTFPFSQRVGTRMCLSITYPPPSFEPLLFLFHDAAHIPSPFFPMSAPSPPAHRLHYQIHHVGWVRRLVPDGPLRSITSYRFIVALTLHCFGIRHTNPPSSFAHPAIFYTAPPHLPPS